MNVQLLFLLSAALWNNQQAGPERCGFDEQRLSFAGSPIEQARCLLSPVRIHGELGPPHARLGRFLEAHVGRRVRIDRARLRALLEAENLPALAATVEAPLARARNNDPAAPFARYFVIHDTSLELPGTEFPANDSERRTASAGPIRTAPRSRTPSPTGAARCCLRTITACRGARRSGSGTRSPTATPGACSCTTSSTRCGSTSRRDLRAISAARRSPASPPRNMTGWPCSTFWRAFAAGAG